MALVVSEINTSIRFHLGGLPTSVLSDEVLNLIIQTNIDKHGDLDENKCIVTYQSLLDALKYLIRKQITNGGGTAGNVKSRKERVGSRQIEVENFEGSAGDLSSFEDLYDFFIKNPQDICASLVDTTKKKAVVIVGGTSQKQYDKVADNPDSRNGWTMSNICNKYGSRNSPRNGSF